MVKYGLPVLALAALLYSLFSVRRMQPVRADVGPPGAPPTAVYAQQVGAVGLVEASSENIALSLPVSGLVTNMYVKAGDRISKGQKLFSLDDRDLRAESALQESSLALAEARLAKLQASPRPEEVPAAEARVREAEALLSDAEVQWQLIDSVKDRRAIRDEDRQRRLRAVQAAKARLEEAQASLALLQAGSWGPDAEIALAEVKQAQRKVDRVRADLARLVVTAPIDGEVLQCKVRVGEYAQAGPLSQPLMLVGARDQWHVRADVDEKDAWRVKASARASASVRGRADQRFPLSFVRVEPYVVPKKNLTGDATERVDTRVLQVVYALRRGAPVYAGQQMDIFIQAGGGQ